ncbi:hypothetical protein ACIA5D_41655 [Actinoplanes sp. NPDC051513]|uniref:hypothetical protein n=1 Tax=Actinoplanes sp. NPDC051513 TaxID=3363908 RepID=UPI0037B2C0B4
MTDDDLRERLRRADPAASLPPLAPDRVSRLLGETMTSTTSPATGAGVAAFRGRRLVALAAAVLVMIVAGGGWLLTRPGEPSTPQAGGPAASTDAGAGPTTKLTLTAVRAKCAEPQAARLAEAADFAFAGTVTGIAGNVVRLHVTKIYKGAPAGQVEVAQAGGGSEQMLGSGKFETGKDYLVASAQGTVMICGFSGEADLPGLRDLYEKAF